MTPDPLWTSLRLAIAQVEGRGTVAGVAVESPSGQGFGHNADRRFTAASTVKIPVLIELFRRVEAGAASLGGHYQLHQADKVAGSGVLSHLGDGIRLTLADLAYLMMSISDNTATNVLISRLGIAEIQAAMHTLGMQHSTLIHMMSGHHVDDPARENWAVPAEYAAVVRALLNNAAASPESCAAMTSLLQAQQNDRRIARHLPREDGPVWGSKTGSLPGIANDVGFVMAAGGPVVLAIFLEGVPDPHTGEEMIGELARCALDDLH